ncbi:inositol oxygenase-like [Rhopilema esculentum]|uniref:inositol oxygenase-like n=1 Tax=Rhopilema esculentum TaxID=499914 RepID=UPI0031CE4920
MRLPNGGSVYLIDPSELHRPEPKYQDLNAEKRMNRDKTQFRDFENTEQNNLQAEKVKETYYKMHTEQTFQNVEMKKEKWCKLDKAEMTILEAIMMLDELVDESDPDIDLPNSVHAFQTAERIRERYPDLDWFHLVGLLHDAGKVMALWGEPQHFVVGDTFPLGCQFQDSPVFSRFFRDNPDFNHAVYSKKYGCYEPNCGLDNVMMSWGHDEYMYQVLVRNNCTVPVEGLYMVRYHSFYPWHSSDDYDYLCSDKDRSLLKWVRMFNEFDLYSKSDSLPDIEALKPYYQSLIDKYCPGKLKW